MASPWIEDGSMALGQPLHSWKPADMQISRVEQDRLVPSTTLARLRIGLSDLARPVLEPHPPEIGRPVPEPVSENELARAFIHTIGQYGQRRGMNFSLNDLADNLEALTREAAFRLDRFRTFVASGGFEVAYQPIVNLATGRIHHFEALVRFNRTKLDVAPYEFITFAENIGLIHEFDLAMCRKVLDVLASSNAPQCSVAVNLSAGSLETPSFASALESLLAHYSEVRGQLAFEVTETAKINDLASVNQFIQGLRSAGHTVCLDDFGAGSAAFQYLRALQVDAVKIDGGYIKNASVTLEGARFLKAMAGLLHELDIDTIAEMVEDRTHLEVIKECHITYGQGYLFGKPSTDFAHFGSEWLALGEGSHATA
jgi:EAL domain-containing protein (putative c-di-GMP-specific phosphodiesterase class I)